jgi:hypothetical protein
MGARRCTYAANKLLAETLCIFLIELEGRSPAQVGRLYLSIGCIEMHLARENQEGIIGHQVWSIAPLFIPIS